MWRSGNQEQTDPKPGTLWNSGNQERTGPIPEFLSSRAIASSFIPAFHIQTPRSPTPAECGKQENRNSPIPEPRTIWNSGNQERTPFRFPESLSSRAHHLRSSFPAFLIKNPGSPIPVLSGTQEIRNEPPSDSLIS